jgi:hypothetical protein
VLALAEVKKGIKGRVMTVRKLRTGSSGSQFAYYLEPVSFGPDQDGEEIRSCVVKFSPGQVFAPAGNRWKAAEELKQALEAACGHAPHKIQLDDGQLVDVASHDAVRDEFYRAVPVKGAIMLSSRRDGVRRSSIHTRSAAAASVHSRASLRYCSRRRGSTVNSATRTQSLAWCS